MTVAHSVRVTGHVQGVFFRAWTKRQAEALGVSGWVRNRADGSVEAHIEGDENQVRQLIERMRQGPGGADVDELTVQVAEAAEARGFEVRT